MQVNKKALRNKQQGISLTGLILVLAVLGLFAILAMKIFPSYMEYRAVRDGIVRAKAAGGSVADVKRTFDKFAEINDISSINSSELAIVRDSGTPEISFAYEKRIPLTDHASLVINYEGTTDPSGVVEAKAE
jgi:hypothetical protein